MLTYKGMHMQNVPIEQLVFYYIDDDFIIRVDLHITFYGHDVEKEPEN